jgi:hypothetical protein
MTIPIAATGLVGVVEMDELELWKTSGNTLLPLPNHLAADAIGDYLCLLLRIDDGEV